MRGFWRKDDLEGRLRESRPQAPDELVQDIVRRVEGSAPSSRKPTPFRRLGLAGIAAVAMVTMFAAFGGAGFAASGVSGAAASTADAISTLVKADKQQASSASNPNRVSRGSQGCAIDERRQRRRVGRTSAVLPAARDDLSRQAAPTRWIQGDHADVASEAGREAPEAPPARLSGPLLSDLGPADNGDRATTATTRETSTR